MAAGSSEVAACRKPSTRDNDLTSSVQNVFSNYDLLVEILLRLPILSLHLFKPVCKQWLSLITSTSFTLRRNQIPTIDPPSGLFVARSLSEYDFVSFDPRIPAKTSIRFNYSKVEICRSCNGLLLCYSHGKYSIYNPVISMFKMLPPILNYDRSGIDDMNLVFDPTKSPYYKVVHVRRIEDAVPFGYFVRIQTYSSETGVWSVLDDRFPSEYFDVVCDGIYSNGAIHRLNFTEPFHVKLDIMDRPVLTNIQTPLPLTVEGQVQYSRKLFNSHGSLLLLCKDYDRSRHLKIYEMKNGYSEWSVKYLVNLDDMMRPFPSWRMPVYWDCYHILSIVLGEQQEDSFMVIELSGKVIQYEFVSETVSKLLDLRKRFRRHDRKEFIASFAHV